MLAPILIGSALAYSYVACIKLAQPESIKHLPRDDIEVIRFRLRRVTYLCLVVLLGLPIAVTRIWPYYPSLAAVIRQLGIIPGYTNAGGLIIDIRNILLCIGRMLVLYCGPLMLYFLERPSMIEDLKDCFFDLHGFRDHIFAPITEEFIYRAAILCVLQPMGLSLRMLTALTPMLFGLAHFHHGWEQFRRGEKPSHVFVVTGFQLLYTTVFGMLANRIYLMTNENLWCAIVVHSGCNIGGFPNLDLKEKYPRFYTFYCFLLIVGMKGFWWSIK